MYRDGPEDYPLLPTAMADALEALAAALETPTAEPTVLEELEAAVREAVQPPASGDAPSPGPPAPALETLDQIAAAFMQLDPGDAVGLERMARALLRQAEAGDFTPKARELFAATARNLQAAGRGEPPAAEAELVRAGELLEAAMTAAANPPDEAPPEPPPDDGLLHLPPDADRDLLAEFVTEARENLQGAEAALLALEVDPSDTEALNTVFRAFHTIKGAAGFLELETLSSLAHHAETLLSRARDGDIRLVGGYADLALRSVDMLTALVQGVLDGLGGEAMPWPPALDELMRDLGDPEAAGASEAWDAPSAAARVGDILVAEGKAPREDIERVAADQGPRPLGEALVRAKAASTTDVAQALRLQRTVRGQSAPDAGVRVRTDRLDSLIETVGELVIAHSMVSQDETVTGGAFHELSRKVSRTTKIVRELQDLSMSMRMVPLRATFQKMARLARDLAHKSHKAVSFITEGEDTEIDRNMVDVVNDPLVHMVRNCVDHGIEPPAQREAAGKPATGTVRLAACHEGGSVVVRIEDDGRGLDRERIAQKAIERGLIESDRGMPDAEVFNLIFAPGFSTAAQVTEVSGRGVGLDVVRRNVEALRGRIETSSEPGRGCAFLIRLPLTLAITDGMLVRVGGEQYIIPTLSIDMTFRPDASALSTVTGRGEMVMVRGELLPMVRLHELYDVPGAEADPVCALVVVLDGGDRRYALLVDELTAQQQVVAKPLGDGLGKIPGVSGGAILADGKVGLILDPQGLSALARRTSPAATKGGVVREEQDPLVNSAGV